VRVCVCVCGCVCLALVRKGMLVFGCAGRQALCVS